MFRNYLRKILKTNTNNTENKANYNLLYEYTLEVYKEIIETWRKIDEKVQKFVTIVSIYVLIETLVMKILITDIKVTDIKVPDNVIYSKFFFCLDFILIISSILFFIFLFLTVYFLLKTLRLQDRKSLPLNNEVINFFTTKENEKLIKSFSEKVSKVNKENKENLYRKIDFIRKAYFYLEFLTYILFTQVIIIVSRLIIVYLIL